ncbi:MAG: hypothetical protein KatS3mg022_3312 [Armatimonadota bacterium]|nr:MAG: hypothetical protein KatS3mg022_3312 [Armatimonadota bacterium]
MSHWRSIVSSLLKQLASEDAVDRCDAVEALGQYPRPSVLRALHHVLLFDPSDLVRCTAAEQIGYAGNPSSLPFLLAALADTSWLVRGWAASAIGDIGMAQYRTLNIKRILEEVLCYENHAFVLLNVTYALYQLGEKQYLPRIIAFLSHRSYRVRCAAANILSEIIEDDNKWVIYTALRDALAKEKTVAAQDAFRKALSHCEQQEKHE